MAADIREGHPTLFDHRATGDDAGAPATTLGPLPLVGDELGLAVHFLEGRAEAILQAGQVISDEVGVHGDDTQSEPTGLVNEASPNRHESTAAYPPYAGTTR